MRYLLFLLSAVLYAQVSIIDPSSQVSIKAWTVGANPQLTTNDDTPHSFQEDDPIYIIGFASQFEMNEKKLVASVIDSHNFTIKNADGSPLSTWGAKTLAGVDQENNHYSYQKKGTRKEYAYVAKLVDRTLAPHPRGFFPLDPTLRARLTDPDGTGPSSAPVMGTEYGPNLTVMADNFSDAGACNPTAPLSTSNCARANFYITRMDANVKYGYIAWVTAFAWRTNQQNTRWKNFAMAYLNNVHMVAPSGRGFFSSMDWTKDNGGIGEDADHVSLTIWFYSSAFSMMRSEMSSGERRDFAKKMLNDHEDGCVSPVGHLTDGRISGWKRWRRSDGQLSSVVVTGGTTRINVGTSTYGMAIGNRVEIHGATESGLNGTWLVTGPEKVDSNYLLIATPAGVSDGTYNNAEMFVDSLFLSGDTVEVPDTSIFSPGDKLTVMGFSYRLGASDIEKIEVSGTVATITFSRNPRVSDITPMRITGSGIEGLDGPYSFIKESVNTYNVARITVSDVAPGTYTAEDYTGILIESNGAGNRYTVNISIKSIESSTLMRSDVSLGAWKSIYGILQPYSESQCGMITASKSHTNVAPLNYARMARILTSQVIHDTDTTITIPNRFASALYGMTVPFYGVFNSEIVRVTNIDIVKDGTTPATLTMERGWWGTIPRTYNLNGNTLAVLLFTQAGKQSRINNEETYWTGSKNNNLTVTRNALVNAFLILLEDFPEKRPEAERWINTALMWFSKWPREYWAAQTSSSSNIGYNYGRQWFFGTQPILVTQNSITSSDDIKTLWEGGWLDNGDIWAMHAKYPWSKNTRFMMSDAGNERNFQARNPFPYWFRFINPGKNSDMLNFFYRDILQYTRNMTGVDSYRTLPFQMAYNVNFDQKIDYRTYLPLGAVFTNPFPGSREMGKNLSTFHSKSDWNDPNATGVVGHAISPNGDHTGNTNRPGGYQIFKRAELICPGGKGCVGGAGQAGLIINPANSLGSVVGAYSKATAILRIKPAAPAGGSVVELTSESQYVAVPRYVTVPEGQVQVAVTTWGYQQPNRENQRITGTSLNTKKWWTTKANSTGAVASVNSTIGSITLSNPSVAAGHYAEATLTLATPAPSGGTNIILSATGDVRVPPIARVRQGQTVTQFPVSVTPGGTSGSFTATSSNEITIPVTITPASPSETNIVNMIWPPSQTNTNYGTMGEKGIIRVLRKDVGDDYTYWQVLGNRADDDGSYCAGFSSITGACTERTTSFHQSHLLHIRESGRPDYVVSYMSHIGATAETAFPGYQRYFRFSHYRGNGNPNLSTGEILSSPPDEGYSAGRDITFIKHNTDATFPGGANIQTRVVLPLDTTNIDDEGLTNDGWGYRIGIWLGSGKADDGVQEVLLVHKANVGDVPPEVVDSVALGSTSSNISGVLIDGDPSYVATFPKEGESGLTEVTFSATPSNAGKAFISALAQGQYSITRNGSPYVSNVCVDAEGMLTFTLASGAADYEVNQVSTAPCNRPQWWITQSLPPGSVNSTYPTANGQVELRTSSESVSFSITAGALPTGVSLASDGVLSGTPTVTGTFNFTIAANDGASTVTRPFDLVIGTASSPAITNASMPRGKVGTLYNSDETGNDGGLCLDVNGGIGPYAWSVSVGAVPSGLEFDSQGCLTGTPDTAGIFNFTARVLDSMLTAATKPFSVVIDTSSGNDVEISSSGTFPNGLVGIPFSTNINAVGGSLPYAWSVLSGSTPSSASIDENGNFSATPVAAGNYSGQIQVTDNSGYTDTLNYTWSVLPGSTELSLNLGALTDATFGQPYSPCISASGGEGPYAFSASDLPPGMTINAETGCFDGYPTMIGSFLASFSVTDAEEGIVNGTATIDVRASGGGVDLSVIGTGSRAISTMRKADLSADTGCIFILRNNEDQIVDQGTFASGPAVRTKKLEDLTEGQTYTFETACQSASGSTEFVTLEVSGTRSVDLTFPKMTGVNNVLVEFGINSLSESVSEPCSEGCTVPLPGLTRGDIYQIKHSYRDASNNVIWPSPVREKLIN